MVAFAWATSLSAQDVPERALQHALDSVRAELAIHGVSATVILSNGQSWNGVSGMAYAGVPVTVETVFEIGSITKTFTGALAVLAAHEGRFDLDDPVARWLPALPNAGRITLRQLLNHTGGLADVYSDPSFIPRIVMGPARVWTAADIFALVGDPDFAPGEGWNYSSTGFVAVGAVLEAVTGRSYAELLRTRIFEPLRLTRSYHGGVEDVPDPVAHAYYDFNNDGVADDLTAAIPNTAFLTAAGAAGAIMSTASDLARWTRTLVTGAFLDESGQSALTTFVERPDGHRYGLGLLRIELDSVVLLGHRGNTGGFSAAAWHAPDLNVTLVVLTNKNGILVTPLVRALMAVVRETEHR